MKTAEGRIFGGLVGGVLVVVGCVTHLAPDDALVTLEVSVDSVATGNTASAFVYATDIAGQLIDAEVEITVRSSLVALCQNTTEFSFCTADRGKPVLSVKTKDGLATIRLLGGQRAGDDSITAASGGARAARAVKVYAGATP